MLYAKIFRTAVVPGGVALAALPFGGKKIEKKEPEPTKPSDLPLYGAPIKCKSTSEQDEYGPLEELVGTMRKEVTNYIDKGEIYKRKAWQALRHQWENSEVILSYLKEEENVLPRSGAIALGGLTGFILALRGGRFRRLAFASIGAGTMAALCYPREAQDYFDNGLILMRQYVLIGYHLVTQTAQDLITGAKEGEKEDPKKTSDQ